MINPDTLLLIFFGLLAIVCLGAAVLCFQKSLKVSGQRDGDLKMFFWALGGMCALIVAGMSAAYILLPILLHNS